MSIYGRFWDTATTCCKIGDETSKVRQSLHINRKPASNLHHAVRIAEVIERPLNLFVSINFGFTICSPEETPPAFQLLRRKFGKWITRGTISRAPATCVWVLERPKGRKHLDSHWLVHVPSSRQRDFVRRLPNWVASVTGGIIDPSIAIKVEAVTSVRGVARYLLKGEHPGLANHFDIDHEPQDVIDGRRSGFTKNIGPAQKRLLRAAGKYPSSRPWIKGKYL